MNQPINPYTHIWYTLLLLVICSKATAQQGRMSLSACFQIALQQNQLLQESRMALSASKYNLDAEKQSYLPKLDLLAGYNYLSRPLEINLQTVRSGIVEGTAQQNTSAVADVYKEITGTDLSPAVQERIYQKSKNVIETVYPNYNPSLSKQSYFTAGVGLRQPLFLGRKLTAARNIAASAVASNQESVGLVNAEVDYLIALQYLRILYLNTMLQQQTQIVDALRQNKGYADEMVKNQVLPPYQRNWANVAVTSAVTVQNNLVLDKQNALLELNKLLGISLDTALVIPDTLSYQEFQPVTAAPGFWAENPAFRLVQSKTDFAKATERINRSFSLPNIFAIGNLQLYQNELPVMTPPWMVGVEMQWTIFNGTQTWKRVKASKELIAASKLSEERTKQELQVRLRVAANRIRSLKNDVAALDAACKEAKTTTKLIGERMQNQLSSPKDVNEAILVEQEIGKAYYTTVLGYYLAIAEYYNTLGTPERITELIP